MFHKVKEVSPLSEKKLKVLFVDGTTKVYDVASLLDRFAAFRPLEDELLYSSVEVDTGSYGIYWNDDIDLSAEELWTHGKS